MSDHKLAHAGSIDDIIKMARDVYGPGVIRNAAHSDFSEIARIPTGIFVLDAQTGGGIPLGRITMIDGQEGSGKSSLCLKTVANAQRMCRKCFTFRLENINKETGEFSASCECNNFEPLRTVYFDSEGQFSQLWAAHMGCDPEFIYVVSVEFGEQGIDIVDAMLRSGEVNLSIVDSLAHLTPMKEIEDSAEQASVGLQARLLNKAMRKWVSAITGSQQKAIQNRTTVLMINQMRETLVLYGDPTTNPGGKGQLYANSLHLRLRRGKAKQDADKTRTFEVETKFLVKKSRVCPPGTTGSYEMVVTPHDGKPIGYVAEEGAIARYAFDFGVIKDRKSDDTKLSKGAKYAFESYEFKTKKDVVERLAVKDGFYYGLRNATISAMTGAELNMDMALNSDSADTDGVKN